MKRVDMITDLIRNSNKPLTAEQVADSLNIRRNEASSDLNLLFKQGLLVKTNSRPVRFQWKKYPSIENGKTLSTDEHSDPFERFAYLNPSLETAIEKAKSAVSYPPNGLNTLVYGETGCGKNYMAEKMWEYKKYLSNDETIPYIYFNCAEYADNPQLLLSQLFGHEKGAFTGALTEKDGIAKKADKGILMLDEIHRLPPTGQELLFNLIDKGAIRKLGGTSEESVNLMIIGSTTEDPKSTLLKTFTRRFPIIIRLPSLMERTIDERMELLFSFFQQESRKLEIPIWISFESLKKLASYQAKGNIGELKNIVNLCCAKSYINYLSTYKEKQGTAMNIELFDLPYEVYSSKNVNPLIAENSNNLNQFIDGMYVYPDDLEEHKFVRNKYMLNLYDFIEKRINYYRKNNVSTKTIEARVAEDLDTYYSNLIYNFSNAEDDNFILKNGIIENRYLMFANGLLNNASMALGRSFTDSLSMAFALHIQQFVERTKKNKIIYNPNIGRQENTHYLEMEFLNGQLGSFSAELGVDIPKDELGFWSLFLSQGSSAEIQNEHIDVVVICHGDHTASSIADMANQLMDVDFVHGIDAPINKTFNEVYYEFLNLIKTLDNKKGVLCLVDMGSLLTIEERVQKDTLFKCKCIPNVTSLMVMDAIKVVLSDSDSDLYDIYRTVYSKYIDFIRLQYEESLNVFTKRKDEKAECSKKTIITVCSTGIGGAEVIKDYLYDHLGSSKYDIIAMSITDNIKERVNQLGKDLKLIIGSMDPKIPGTKFVYFDKIFSPGGIEIISRYMNAKKEKRKTFAQLYIENTGVYDEVLKNSNKFAPSLQSAVISETCLNFCNQIDEQLITLEKDNSFYVGLILHLMCMFERAANNDVLDMTETTLEVCKQCSDKFRIIKQILDTVIAPMNLKINDAEISNLVKMVD